MIKYESNIISSSTSTTYYCSYYYYLLFMYVNTMINTSSTTAAYTPYLNDNKRGFGDGYLVVQHTYVINIMIHDMLPYADDALLF